MKLSNKISWFKMLQPCYCHQELELMTISFFTASQLEDLSIFNFCSDAVFMLNCRVSTVINTFMPGFCDFMFYACIGCFYFVSCIKQVSGEVD